MSRKKDKDVEEPMRVRSSAVDFDHTTSISNDDQPLYLHIANKMRTAILVGIYPVGSKIPTERELCEKFAVSRHTIRDALRRLREDGLIASRQQGGRPIVSAPTAKNAVKPWTAEVDKTFLEYVIGTRIKIRCLEMVTTTKTLASQFGVNKGETWLRVSGFRQSGEAGPVVGWYDYLINAEYAAIGRLIPRHVGSVNSLIEDFFNEKIVTAQYALSAVSIPHDLAEQLAIPAGAPAQKIITTCETQSGKTALICLSLHHLPEHRFVVKLKA